MLALARDDQPGRAGREHAGGDAGEHGRGDRRADRGGPPLATPRALGPAATVRAFYERAAEDDFAGAWRLAGPGMRDVYGGSRAEFERQLGSLERIEFPELALEALGLDGDRACARSHAHGSQDRCTGTLRTTRSAGRWLVEPATASPASEARRARSG